MVSAITRNCLWRAAQGAVLLGALAGGIYLIFLHVFPAPRGTARDDFRPSRFILPQEPVVDVPVRPVSQAAEVLEPGELVLAVTIGNEARAYPVNMLNEPPGRKILNDTLGGRAIAATW
jgi:hypothetical protein